MSERWTYDELVKGFWDGKDKNGNRLKLNNDGIREALRMALKDFTPRTEKKSEKAPEKYGVDEMLVDLGVLVTKYVEFFDESEKTKQEFDEWHEEQCKEFMDCIGEKFERLAYGKAQKIINMTFKYTFCLDGAKEKQEYFKYCHMPLDSLTLEWFWRAGNLKKYEEKMMINEKKVSRKYPAWSKMEQTGTNDVYGYKEIEEAIWNYFADSSWTPLTAEFLIWRQIQIELAAEGLFKQLIDLDENIIDNENCRVNQKLKKDYKEKYSSGGEIKTVKKRYNELFRNLSISDKIDYLKNNMNLIHENWVENFLDSKYYDK